MLQSQKVKKVFSLFRRTPVLRRLIPSIVRRSLLWTGRQYAVSWVHEMRWLLDCQTIGDRTLASWGEYEEEQFDYLSAQLARERCSVFLDIGCFAGYYSIRLKRANPQLDVHAFEPHPRNRDQLHANLFLNDLSGQIAIYPLAAGSENKMGRIGFKSARNRGGAMVDAPQAGGFEVKIRKIDDVLEFKNHNIIIKIDVEGYETRSILGMKRLLNDNNCVLQIESWDENQENLLKTMKDVGYVLINKIGWDHYFKKPD